MPDWNDVRRRFDFLESPTPEEVLRIYASRPPELMSDLDRYINPEGPRKVCLLWGQRRSGKSTELLRLMMQQRQHSLIVFVDLGRILPHDFGILDVLFALGAALYRAAEEQAPGQLDRRLYTDLVTCMGDSVQKWIEKRDAGIAVPAPAKTLAVLAVGFIGGPGVAATVGKAADKALEALSLKQSETTELERRVKESPRPAEVLLCLTAIIDALENRMPRRPLLLRVDGLDFARPALARDVASREDILSSLPCRAVIVATPELVIAHEAPELQKVALVPLPHLPVTGPAGRGELPDSTRRFFEDLVARRLPEGLTRPDILDEEEVGRIGRMSGGVIRDLVRMVYHASAAAARLGRPRLDRECVDEAINELAGSMGPRAMVANLRDLLQRVAADHALPGGPEALNLLHPNLILLSRTARHTWYDVHPAVKEGLAG